jgi:N-acetylglucosamine-6-phosphate deacetylase
VLCPNLKERSDDLKAVVNGAIYKDHEFLQNKALIYDSKIEDIIDYKDVDYSKYEQVIDAKGLLIVPGFIDIHLHGYGGYDTMDDSDDALINISKRLVENGVTSFLPTTMTMSVDLIHQALQRIRNLMTQSFIGAKVLGAHFEGPFINAEYKGAQSEEFITYPKIDILKDYEDVIKVITMAPEMRDAMSFIETISNKGIAISIGHTGADYETVVKAYEHGAKGITHLFNAMTGLQHRKPGCVGAALLKDFCIEVIADNVHMNPVMYELLLKTKKLEHLILITDCMRAGGMPEGSYDLGGQKVIVADGRCLLENGTLAGSTLKLNQGLTNFMLQTSLELENAVKLVTENPARYLNIFDKVGSFDQGKLADITIIDPQINVHNTIVEGVVLYEKKD